MTETFALAALAAAPDEPDPLAPVIICGELRTGRILTTVPCVSAPWSMVHNDAGTVEANIPLRAMSLSDAAELVGYLDPTRCFLAVRIGDNILEAGPIWRHDWNNDTGILKVSAAGLWSLWDHRKVMRVLAAGENPAATSLAWNALSLGTIAKRLVESAQSHAGPLEALVLPADEGAADDADHSRTFAGYSVTNMGDALRNLTTVINGPDIRFDPRLSADRLHVEWVMRVGTEAQPLLYQSGQDWRWDSTVPRSGISDLSVTRDATGMGQRAWIPGSGSQTDQLISMREDLTALAAGYPLLEVDEAHSSVLVPATLDAHGDALLARSARPWVTWSWTAQASTAPLLGDYRPGDWAKVAVPADHPYLSALGLAGDYRTRILGVSGDLSQVVKITAQPTMEAR